MKYIIISACSVLAITIVLSACQPLTHPQVNYFNQQLPSKSPEVFAPGLISLENRWEGNASFSANGKAFYFNVFTDSMREKAIYWSEYQAGQWSQARKFEETGEYDSWEPFISQDGNEFLFVSTRPPGEPEWNGRIWKLQRDANQEWTELQMVDLGYHTKNGYWFPNYSHKNNQMLYFGGNIEGLASQGKGDLYVFDQLNDTVINLANLNSEEEDWDPFIAPDESFILWASARKGGYGGTDLYVSFKTGLGWGDPINLGPEINSEEFEVAPRISHDAKILFFDRPIGGTQDIYWVSSSVITALKNK